MSLLLPSQENKATGGAVFPVGENGSGNSAISSYIQATAGSVDIYFRYLLCRVVSLFRLLNACIQECPKAGREAGAHTVCQSCSELATANCYQASWLMCPNSNSSKVIPFINQSGR